MSASIERVRQLSDQIAGPKKPSARDALLAARSPADVVSNRTAGLHRVFPAHNRPGHMSRLAHTIDQSPQRRLERHCAGWIARPAS